MKSLSKLFLIGGCATLLVGCTKVDLYNEASRSHTATLKVKYDWGSSEQEKPEQMHLVVARILNTYHYCFTTRATDGSFMVVPPKEADSPETVGPNITTEEEQEVLIPQADAPILGGEYFMMAFTKDDEKLEVLNLKEFQDDPSVSVKRIHLSNKFLDKKEFPSLKPNDTNSEKTWMDFNPGYKFVSSPGRVFISRVNYMEFNTGTTYTQSFSPTALSQRIFFTFTMEFDNGGAGKEYLTVDPSDLYIEIAGVIPEVGLADGLLYTNSVRRMFLKTGDGDVKKTFDENNHLKAITYKGYIDAFGLMPGPDVHAISGPGVLRLTMKVGLPDGQSRTICTSCNISAEIAAANLTKATGIANVREKVVDEGTVRISNNIQINTQKVIAGNADGVVGWDQSFIDVDI